MGSIKVLMLLIGIRVGKRVHNEISLPTSASIIHLFAKTQTYINITFDPIWQFPNSFSFFMYWFWDKILSKFHPPSFTREIPHLHKIPFVQHPVVQLPHLHQSIFYKPLVYNYSYIQPLLYNLLFISPYLQIPNYTPSFV